MLQYYHVSMVVSYLYNFCLWNKTEMNFQSEYRWNTCVLNTVFNATIYKNKFQIFSSNVTCLLRKVSPMIFIHSPQEGSVLCTKCGLHITNESCFGFIKGCAGIACGQIFQKVWFTNAFGDNSSSSWKTYFCSSYFGVSSGC